MLIILILHFKYISKYSDWSWGKFYYKIFVLVLFFLGKYMM